MNRNAIYLTILLISCFVLLFYNISNYYLWGDEGEIAFYGKSILQFGLPYGFDGRNLHEVRNGLLHTQNFLPLLHPWLQFYTAALSMKIFGISTFGARALFALLAIMAVLAQYQFVAAYFRNQRLALINTFLLVTSVSFLLFARQCRYFSIVMLLTPLIGLLYLRYQGRIREIASACLLFFLFLYANYLIAIPTLAGMAISFFLFDDRRKAVRFFLIPLPFLALVTAGYVLWLSQYGIPHNPGLLRNIHPADFLRIAWLYIKDYNATQLLPFGILLALLISWYREGIFKRDASFAGIRKEVAVFSIVIIFTFILSFLTPQISAAQHSDIRYATAIFPLLILLQAFVVEKVYLQRKWAACLLIVLIAGTNIFTFTPFRSYFSEYVRENVLPFDNSVKAAVRFLDTRIRQDDTVMIIPNHMLGSMEFYLGDRALFCNVIGEDNRNLLAAGVNLPRYIYSKDVKPDWIVFFGMYVDLPHTQLHLKNLKLSDYRMHQLPIFGPDVSRPEIFWRSFDPVQKYLPVSALWIMERIR